MFSEENSFPWVHRRAHGWAVAVATSRVAVGFRYRPRIRLPILVTPVSVSLSLSEIAVAASASVWWSLLRKCHTCFFLSFLRKQESSEVKGFWTPASAGVTAFL